jgi:FkbH-like protein
VKLIDALAILREAPAAGDEPLPVLLACGFEPLHLRTFLAAHLQKRFPGRRLDVATGLYGDLAGTLERAGAVETAAVVIEWSDLDPRLDVRAAGGWSSALLPDVVRTAERAAARLQAGIAALAERCRVAVCPPTLPLPPVTATPAAQASPFEVELGAVVAALTAWAARQRRVRAVRAQRLDALSPPGERLDVASALGVGLPYRRAHAATVAALLAELLAGPAPKKGLITDLDDTLWRGLLGEVGVKGVTWQLRDGAHVHALYQGLLAALAEEGVLVAVASRNDAGLVEEALRRADLLLRREQLFPVEAGWGAKSEAVTRILRAWNIAAADVVFVDDTPAELAEVAAAHPGLEPVRFPADDPVAAWATLERLRDRFAKAAITGEDRLRAQSLPAALEAASAARSGSFERFLAEARAEITVDLRTDPEDPRALELVNKTNQFTLNGRRYSDGQWRALLARPGAFLLRAAYRDRFGPLGTIAVLAGRRDGATASVDVWVMSCRAFARRIEHQCLRQLAARLAADALVFDYVPSGRNGPVGDLFGALLGTPTPGGRLTLSRAALEAACPPLHHTIREVTDE